MTKVLKFRTGYGDRKREGFETTGESLTQQSHDGMLPPPTRI